MSEPRPVRQYTSEDVDLLAELAAAEARRSFYAYRRVMHPGQAIGWFYRSVSHELSKFYDELMEGKRPKLLLLAPPQHGKSTAMTDMACWIAGRNPRVKTIFSSYSDDLGTRANAEFQRQVDSDLYRTIFPATRLPSGRVIERRNSHHVDLLEFGGSFRNTTVLGPVTGQSLDLGLIDDPIKGRKEAQSEVVRESTWQWLTDDFFTRFSDHAGLLMIMTRWHVDDPAGRFLDRFPDTRVVEYEAIASKDEEFRKRGEPLFPEFKSLEFLMERKTLMTKGSWESVYQQKPIIVGGGIFPIEQFEIIDARPAGDQVRRRCRSWDKAGTTDDGAYTAGVLMAALKDGTFVIEDVVRGQWSALEREKRILQTAQLDGQRVYINVEQEPGSGGKESAERTVRMLAGYSVNPDRVTGPKEIRADPYAAQVQAGNFKIVKGGWNRAFLEEHEEFPNGPYMDQVDAAGAAFTQLTLGSQYDTSMAWVRGG
jgi:predicted phage terminase large subunit-like protein